MSTTSTPERQAPRDGMIPRAVNLTIVRRRRGVAHAGSIHAHERRHGEASRRHSGINERVSAYRVPAKPLVYSFFKERGWAGMRSLAASAVCLGIGIFLFTQIGSANSLRVQMGLIATVLCFLGLYLIPSMVRDLFGSLRVDSNGIRMSPGFVGFFIPWNELTRWNVDLVTFRFRSTKAKHAFATDLRVLSNADRYELREVLRDCVTAKEGMPVSIDPKS